MAESRVLWTEAARTDLETIVDFTAEEDPSNALRIIERLEERACTLGRFPERGRVLPELRLVDVFLYRELIEKPRRIIYRYSESEGHEEIPRYRK